MGVRGTKDECLDHIEKVWTDMRPLSLRKQMEGWERNPPPTPEPLPEDDAGPLVERLSGEGHQVEIRTNASDKLAYMRERLEIGHVHVLFPETRGGTELGLALEEEIRDQALKSLDSGNEIVLEAKLNLDGTAVRCNARVSVPELAGTGGYRSKVSSPFDLPSIQDAEIGSKQSKVVSPQRLAVPPRC